MPKYISELTLVNFQSHQETTIKLDAGFNVIIGASDQGKSAVIRALRWLLYNEPRGTDFMRAGTNACRVKAIFNDGVTVTRERTPSKNRYVIQYPGQEETVFEGFGNQVPAEVIQAHGITKVRLDEDKDTILNLGGQLEGPFLLADNGSVKAKAIGRISGVHVIDNAQRDTVRDIVKSQQEERQLMERRKTIKEQLENFADLPDLGRSLEAAQEKLQLLKDKHRLLERIRELKGKYDTTTGLIVEAERNLLLTKQVNSASQRLQQLNDQRETHSRLLRYKKTFDDLTILKLNLEKFLAETARLPVAENKLYSLINRAEQCRKLSQCSQRWLQISDVLGKVEGYLQASGQLVMAAEKLNELDLKIKIRNRLQQLKDQLREQRDQLAGVQGILNRTSQVDKGVVELGGMESKLLRYNNLNSYRSLLRDLDGRVVVGKEFLRKNEVEIAKQLLQYESVLRQLGKCPLCLGEINEQCLHNIKQEYQGGE